MGKMENVLRDEIARLARKEAKKINQKTEEDIKSLKGRISELNKEIRGLRQSRAGKAAETRMLKVVTETSPEKVEKARVTPLLLKKLRKRLGITQTHLAELLGVSPAAVTFWETGKSQPRANTKARIVALRNMGKRDVQKLLEEKKSVGGEQETTPEAPAQENAESSEQGNDDQ